MPSQRVEQRAGPVVEGRAALSPRRLVAVVGFDGSESAYRALDAAAQLISGRPGSIVVVFVAHVPATAELTAEGMVGVLNGFDALQQQFTEAIRSRLDLVEQRWRLERRNGVIAHELVAAADQVSRDYRDYGADATVVIVVGSAMHTYHHVVGSVPVALARNAKYPILVVP
jgi:nucleotide-binding universal stress UspA family protein